MGEVAADTGPIGKGVAGGFLRAHRLVIKTDLAMHPVADRLHQSPAPRDAGEGIPGHRHHRLRVAVAAGIEEAVGVDRQRLDRALGSRWQHWIGTV